MPLSFLSACRGCGGTHLTPAFTIGQDNAWVFCGDANGEHGCGLLQRATIGGKKPAEPMHRLSWTEQYRLRGAATGALEMVTTRDGRALDIGCGRGDLLSVFPRWIEPVGIDARLRQSGEKDWGYGIAADFMSDEGQTALHDQKGDGFDIVTAIDIFDRTDDPRGFLLNVKSLLARDGVFVLETSYAALALTRTLTSAFHRHAMAVYSLATLEHLLREAGLRIVRGAMTETSAGALRLYVTHQDYRGHDYGPWFDSLARLWDEEASLCLTGRGAHHAYQMRLQARSLEIAALKQSMIRADEHAYVLGTCARTFAMLQGGDFDYEVISAHIGDQPRDGFPEVITEDVARDAPADALIGPSWRRRECLEGWHDQIMAGMRLIFLEPELLVVDHHNYAAELGRALAVTDGPGSVETLRAALRAMRGPNLQVVSETLRSV